MNLTSFKASLSGDGGGPARPNLFYVTFTNTKSRGVLPLGDLSFFCKSANMPGFNLKTFDYASRNYGFTQQIPFGINSEPLNATFILDSNHRILDFFHLWMNEIYRYDSRGTSNRDIYEIGYIEDYSSTMTIYFLSSDASSNPNADKYVMQLTGVYPTNISSIALSWEDTNSIATLPIQFSYETIEVNRNISGSYADTYRSIVDGLSSVYFETGRTTHSNSPMSSGSIQDYIDMKAKHQLSSLSDGSKLIQKII